MKRREPAWHAWVAQTWPMLSQLRLLYGASQAEKVDRWEALEREYRACSSCKPKSSRSYDDDGDDDEGEGWRALCVSLKWNGNNFFIAKTMP